LREDGSGAIRMGLIIRAILTDEGIAVHEHAVNISLPVPKDRKTIEMVGNHF